jgi:enamine deaminase RidA (YjgF/YER057c/UK114 family)
MNRLHVNPEHLTFAGMSQGVRAAGLLAISGQVGLREDGTISEDPREQAEQAFLNLEAVLGLAGMGFRDITKLTCYLTDASYYDGFAEAKSRRFTTDPPASTTVVVAALLDPRMLIEVEAIAVAGAPVQ